MAETTNLPIGAVELIPSVPDDTRVLELANQPSDINVADSQVVVGCCGSVEYRKGVDLFVAAAAQTRQLAPEIDLRFIWVGDIDPAHPLKDDSGVEFVGARINPYPIVRQFDIATLPSRDDPFPLVVLEAMLLRRPVVAYDVGGVAGQIGATGMLVKPEDVAGLASSLACLVKDPVRRKRMGDAAHERAVECYSTAAFARRTEALVRSVAEEHRR